MEALPLPLSVLMSAAGQDQQIQAAVREQRGRLLRFIERRVPDPAEAEDILQDVFAELVESYRLLKPVEQAAAWLFRVARNRIIDRYRRVPAKVTVSLDAPLGAATADEPARLLQDVLPAPDDAPENRLLRETIMQALTDALAELPAEQRQVFVWHELEDKSFNEMVAETGVPLKTLISRKHYAVKHLRKRLRTLYEELFSE
ncbi:sigma-70 family RNA polymerase sigma factor [Hymenobacter sp. RP-2-7]|uniref:Sigma-70 family RNA polymerase sigma factor n=2 Tax=Hymenobacter polaris TaxID=2682546 RepID=A0A7Y0FKE3_9BACT|nr:sigma-70 family RNA polymerase sigma factor [Hymenobacter polaris]